MTDYVTRMRKLIGTRPLLLCGAAVVSHGIVLSAVRARLLGRPLTSPAEWRALPFASVAQVDALTGRLTEDFRGPH